MTPEAIHSLAGLGRAEIVTYLALTVFADENGEGYPSREALSQMTGYAPQTVTNAMQGLMKAGLVERRQTGPRRWTFRLCLTRRPVSLGNPTSGEAKEQTIGTYKKDSLRSSAALVGLGSEQPMLDGSVERRTDWPNEVRKAYHQAWAAAHGGQPPAATADRMRGKVREVERAISRSEAHDEWPAWVEAARRAAQAGAWDLVNHYRPQQSKSKHDQVLDEIAALRAAGI